MIGDPASDLVLFSGAFAGALVSSFSGFAFAPVAGVFLLTVFSPKSVVPALMLCSVIVQTATLVYLRRSLAFGSAKTMLIGGMCGVPVALALFHRMDAQAFQIGFGLFLAGYSMLMILRPCTLTSFRITRGHEAAVGFFGGVVGGLTAMPGAVPTLYCDCRGMAKEAQRAMVQPFILLMQVFSLAAMALHGDLGADVTQIVLRSLPALGLGVAVGLVLFGRVPDASFRRVVLMLLLATGLALAVQPNSGSESGASQLSSAARAP